MLIITEYLSRPFNTALSPNITYIVNFQTPAVYPLKRSAAESTLGSLS